MRTTRLGSPPVIPSVCEGAGQPGLVSVLIPTHNREYIIRSAIDSVIAQTYGRVEIVVVDDGSTDGTRAVLSRYGDRIRYIHQANRGLASARNTGLAAATGEFVAFQDSDDVWEPWKLSAQVALMRHFPSVALCWTDMIAVDPSGAVIHERYLRRMYSAYGRIGIDDIFPRHGRLDEVYPESDHALGAATWRVGEIFSAMLLGNLVHPPTALMRREHIGRAGGLDESYTWAGEDYEFFWRLSRFGEGALIEAPGMRYRVGSEDQYTHPSIETHAASGYLLAIERQLAQNRARVHLSDAVIDDTLAEAYAWAGECQLMAGETAGGRATRLLWQSLRLRPRQKRVALLLPLSLLPPRAFRHLRTLKQRLAGRIKRASAVSRGPE